MKKRTSDTRCMALALRLAARGRGSTSPNPMVGAVVLSGSKIVGAGYHRRAGGPHAEVVALRQAGLRAKGGTLYVTLEPCSHQDKRTPPCVPTVQASNVRRVVIAMPDPNPRVSGRGIRRLRHGGIAVDVGCLGAEAARLNEPYSHWVRTGRPFVLLKSGMTLDGKIATATGDSQWITDTPARQAAHQLRSEVDAILVGIGTVFRDDPRLTARRTGRRGTQLARHQPLRVVMDSRLRIPLTAKVLARARGSSSKTGRYPSTLIATTSQAPQPRLHRLRSLGVPVVVLPTQAGRVSLPACLTHLGRLGVTSVMIEGGSELNASALRAGAVNRVILFVSPTLLGGQDAKSLIGGRSPRRLPPSWQLTDVEIRRAGRDLVIKGTVENHRTAGARGAGTTPARRR